jgi:hypothetical protein
LVGIGIEDLGMGLLGGNPDQLDRLDRFQWTLNRFESCCFRPQSSMCPSTFGTSQTAPNCCSIQAILIYIYTFIYIYIIYFQIQYIHTFFDVYIYIYAYSAAQDPPKAKAKAKAKAIPNKPAEDDNSGDGPDGKPAV